MTVDAGRDLRRVAIVAGEESGDLLGAGLVRKLKERFPQAEFIGVGGSHMREAGVRTLFSAQELSVMGLVEVLPHLFRLYRLRRRLLRHFTENPPDVFVGVDLPDFNFGLERKLRRRGCFSVHLGSPSVWAWRRNRLKSIRKSTDLMLCLFAFETPYYRDAGIAVEHVGHPLADRLPASPDRAAARRRLGLPQTGRVIALLPGSRGAELQRLGPHFLQAAGKLARSGGEQSFIAAFPNEELRAVFLQMRDRYATHLPLRTVLRQSHLVMEASDLMISCLGTATLEGMLLQCPMVLGYRMHPLTKILLRRFVHIQRFSLPNILCGEALVPEFLQEECNADRLAAKASELLADDLARRGLRQRFRALGDKLRLGADRRAADAVIRHFQQREANAIHSGT